MNDTPSHTKLQQFYSLNLPDVLQDTRAEQYIVDVDITNLFAAHLHSNNVHFGALDKTLSGFVMIDIQGDDYYLYDARDSGWVYCQTHTDRTIKPYFESLEAYLASLQQQTGRSPIGHRPESNKAVPTVELAERYQWAVWFFGRATQEPHEAAFEERWMALAANWFANAIDEIDTGTQMFAEERNRMKDDVQLAVWWLMVATALADQTWIDEVIQHGPVENQLFDSFAHALRSLGFSETLAELPEFKKRRGRFLYNAARPGSKLLDHVYDATALYTHVRDLTARSLIIDPQDAWGDKIHTIHVSCEELNDPTFLANLAQKFDHNSIQALLLKSYEALLHNDTTNKASAAVAQWILATPPEEASLAEIIPLFPACADLIPDRALVFQACKKLLPLDKLHFPLVALATRTAYEISSPEAGSFDELRNQLEHIRPIYKLLIPESTSEELHQGLALADKLEAPQKELLAQKIRTSLQPFHALAAKWAASNRY